jgi:Ca-activated chloride channel homolog
MFRRLYVLPVLMLAWALAGVAPHGQTSPVAAQPAGVTITGSVVDAALAPIAGVAVTLERDGRVQARTTTDASGAFRFAGVAPGNYRVRAEHTGFPAFARDLRVPSDATALQMPIVLARAVDELSAAKTLEESVTVSGASPMVSPSVAPNVGAAAGRGGGQGASGGLGPITPFTPSVARTPQFQGGSVDGIYRDEPNDPWSGYRYGQFPQAGPSYAHVDPNRFQPTREQPLSTFGADVDTASYSNVRRFLSGGHLPPRDAVRVEDFVNYFHFAYDAPRDNRPIGLTTEIGDCPWAPSHKLVLIGARAKAPITREITGRNIVLLIDVSGSMAPPERLPLIKTALGMFVDTLQPDDRLAIVTYAGSSGVALPSTPARQRDVIQRAIGGLSAGGSTNGGQGLIMAYRTAREAFIPGGVNRVILATDGDFNVGIVKQSDLVSLIERERNSGVFLSVFGVGSDNLKDSTMELLADRGNGHYAYLDSLQEARRVLVHEADATLETVAKDVKFQVEFNPAVVSAWKLIGYEDRLMAAQDFNNDRKDGGEMGAGHTVTVLYEVVPAGVENPDGDVATTRPAIDPLKYQTPAQTSKPAPPAGPVVTGSVAARSGEWLTVKVRYKAPEGEQSDLIVQPVRAGGRVQHLPLASAVAEFGMLLRAGSRDGARWDSLARRTERLQVQLALRPDVDAFKELVAIAGGLARLK